MKRILPLLMLVLTGLELQAQVNPTNVPFRRLPRYGYTNGVPGVSPRYQPGTGVGGQGPAGNINPNFPGRQRNPAGAGGLNGNGVPSGTPGADANAAFGAGAGASASQEEMIPPGLIDFEGVDINEVLKIYAKLVNRTLLRGALPQSQIILNTQTPLTKTEAIQALQAVLALNGVSLINIGDKFVKVLPSDQANSAGEEIDRTGSTNIPALGSYITHVVQLKYVKPSLMAPVLQPFAKLNSIIPLDDNGILVIRDYAENVKRMLEMIDMVDVSVPAEYISEVVPIRYAKVDDIASALNALGGGGGAMVSVGTAPSGGQISGLRSGGMSGIGAQGSIGGGGIGGGIGGSNPYQSGTTGSTFGSRTSPNGTSTGGSTFQQRLNNIINATSPGGGGGGGSKDQIQLFGQTKIIPNESSSSLLIYATRQDLEVIKGIIGKLDVPLAQVLIEAAIIDYSLGPNTFNFGVSAAQNPVQNGQFIGGGGINNASGSNPFMQFVQNTTLVTNFLSGGVVGSVSSISSITSAAGTNAAFGNNLPGGGSYFANIGPNWDVALTAAASDSHASVIQRPRILTEQAKAAQFFVGDTVPYVTSSYGGGYGGVGYGNSYSQLSVGVELDVTPFINPDGVVSMDIQQEIDDLNGYTQITGVGNVPNTIKRTLNSSITVRDRDTVMLGGFIKSDKSTSRSGIPFLMDIPILGNLFLSRSDSKQREELIVLMRPTVLATPGDAATNTLREERRLPGVARSEADNSYEERTRVEDERKYELRKHKSDHSYEGVYTVQPDDVDYTNNAPVGSPKSQSNTNNVPANPGAGAEDVTPDLQTAPGTSTNGASTDPQQSAAAALARKMDELNANGTGSAR